VIAEPDIVNVAMTTPGGAWLIAALVWPVIAVLLTIAAGGRYAARIALASMPAGSSSSPAAAR